MPYLRGSQLLGYVDGSIIAPEKMISETTTEGALQRVLNPAYTTWLQHDQIVLSTLLSSLSPTWRQHDQILLSALLSSLSPEVLAQVLLATAAEVWTALERIFSLQSRARTMQVRMQLANTHKKDLSAAEYFAKMKALADAMASAGCPLKEEELISYIRACWA